MSKRIAAILFCSVFVLGACADRVTSPGVTATPSQISRETSAMGSGVTPLGADESITTGAPFGKSRAATGGSARGHFELSAPFPPIETEQYSFVALSVGYFPNAKGQLEGKIARATSFQDIHVEVDCLVVNGNEAWMSGPITRLIVNGVAQDPRGRQVAWRVQDNGEGTNSPPDMGTIMFVGFPQACLVYFFTEDLPMVPNANGNIQVSQK